MKKGLLFKKQKANIQIKERKKKKKVRKKERILFKKPET